MDVIDNSEAGLHGNVKVTVHEFIFQGREQFFN